MLELLTTASNTDVQIFYLINFYMQNALFDFIMPFISEIGYFGVWIVVSILIFLFGGEKGKKVALLTWILEYQIVCATRGGAYFFAIARTAGKFSSVQ